MPWGRVDDGFWSHAKVAELDEGLRKGCVALFWLANSWANDRLTDGRIPPGTLRVLGADVAEAEELVRVGLWETDGTGWQVHDFLERNKSRKQVEQDRLQRTLAGRAGAQQRWHPDSESLSDAHGDSLSEMHGGTDGRGDSEPLGEMDAPSPVPRTPENSLLEDRSRPGREAKNERPDVQALLDRPGWKRVTKPQRRILDEILDRHDVTGPEFSAEVIRSTPLDADPLAAVMAADTAYQKAQSVQAEADEAAWAARGHGTTRPTNGTGPTRGHGSLEPIGDIAAGIELRQGP